MKEYGWILSDLTGVNIGQLRLAVQNFLFIFFNSLSYLFVTGLPGAAWWTEGHANTHLLMVQEQNTTGVLCAPLCSHRADTLLLHTPVCQRAKVRDAVSWSRSGGIKKPKLITTPEILVLKATWKTPETSHNKSKQFKTSKHSLAQ